MEPTTENMTIGDLYNLLQIFAKPGHPFEKSIIPFLNNDKKIKNNERWNGKDKQESILRLFAPLKLISDFTEIGYKYCVGNFNQNELRTDFKISNVLNENAKQ